MISAVWAAVAAASAAVAMKAAKQANGPPWWALAVPGALASWLLAARLAPTDPAEWALLAAWLILTQAGVYLSAVDIAVHRLPTLAVSLTGAALAIAITTATLLERNSATLTRAGLGALSVGGVYLLLFVLNPNGIGAGDVKLAVVTGLALGSGGWRTVAAGLVLPYLLCAPFAAAMVIRRHGHRSTHIPFGPFLIAGSIAAVLTAQ